MQSKLIQVHWHFHKRCYSITNRSTGLVIEHTTEPIYLKDVKFVVRPAGHARVLREQRKNVHAFVRGERLREGSRRRGSRTIVGYNPYKANFWYEKETMRPVVEAAWVRLSVVDGVALIQVSEDFYVAKART